MHVGLELGLVLKLVLGLYLGLMLRLGLDLGLGFWVGLRLELGLDFTLKQKNGVVRVFVGHKVVLCHVLLMAYFVGIGLVGFMLITDILLIAIH